MGRRRIQFPGKKLFFLSTFLKDGIKFQKQNQKHNTNKRMKKKTIKITDRKMKRQGFVPHPWREHVFGKELFKGAKLWMKNGKPLTLEVYKDLESIIFKFEECNAPETIIINEFEYDDFRGDHDIIK